MSALGIFGGNTLGAIDDGLGTIPAKCWGQPSFEKCKAQQWETARGQCDSAYGGGLTAAGNTYGRSFSSTGDCIDYVATLLAEQACVPQCDCTVEWRGDSKNTAVEKLQRALNERLDAVGLQKITADGFFGGETCGALEAVVGKDASKWGGSEPARYACPDGMVLPECKTTTAPKKKGAGDGGDNKKIPALPPATDESSTMAIVGGAVVLGALGLGLWYLSAKPRRSSGSRTTQRMSRAVTVRRSQARTR